jgi:hypothetical protein
MHTKVYSVEVIEFALLKSNPPQLLVSAFGTVNSGGWSDGRLVPWIYVQPPPDGIWDFDFIGDAPQGNTIMPMLPFFGSTIMESIPPGFKGVRVHASANNLVKQAADGGAGERVVEMSLTGLKGGGGGGQPDPLGKPKP